jgi:hypothetical protein
VARTEPAGAPRALGSWATLGDSGRGGDAIMAAWRMLAVALICFALWTFFDARQLYQGAVSSPIGVRRSVAMTILRPVARVEEALGLDRIVNGLDRLIGKTGSPGGSAIAPLAPPPTVASGPSTSLGSGGKGRPSGSTTPLTTPVRPAGIAQPSAAHPLTVLDVGDSIGKDLGIGLADELGNVHGVQLLQNSVGDTGLANLGYYNWLAELPVQVAKYRPQVIVIMLGGNDAQSFQAGNQVVDFGTAAWHRIYPQRVGQLMSEATKGGAQVIWVGLPIMGPTSGLSNTSIQAENAVFASEAKLHPGVTYLSSWKLFENASGQYATYLTEPGGNVVEVRDPDEVHFDPPGGTDLIGSFVVKKMEALWHIKL